MCFIRLLLPLAFFMSAPLRYCLEEKRRKATSTVGLPLGSPEGTDAIEENEMFFYGH